MSVISTPAIKADINANIFQNSDQLITGTILNAVLINIADSYLNRVTGGLLMQVETGYSTLVTITDPKAFTHKSYVDTAVSGLLPGGGTSAQYFAGDKTLVDFGTSVRATLLTGLPTFTNTVISTTDSVLGAFSNLQGQISAINLTGYVPYVGSTSGINQNGFGITNSTGLTTTTVSSTYSQVSSSALSVIGTTQNTVLSKISLTINETSLSEITRLINGALVYQGTTFATTFLLPTNKGVLTTDTFAMLSDLSGFGSGTVTSILAGTGMSFTTITGSGSVAIDIAKVPYFSSGLSGTPSSSTYLRGDGVWATVSSGGTINGTIANTEIAYGTGANTIDGNINFVYDSVNNAITLGGTPLANSKIHADGTLNDYLQYNIQNLSSGANASSDYVATADNGDNTINFIDMGINSSAYSAGAFNITSALDGYLYTNGGNLAIGTATADKDVIFHSGGTTTSDRSMVIRGTSADKGYVGFLEGTTANPTLLGKIHIVNEDDAKGTFFADRYSNAVSPLATFRRARGTFASPTAIQNNDGLGGIAFRGYGATGFSSGSRAMIIARSIENWTDTTHGTSLVFMTTPATTASSVESMTLNNTGISTVSTTFSVFNTVTTTVNAFQAGTAITIGATSGTATIRNTTVALTGGTLTGATTQNLFNTTTSTLNAFGLVTAGNIFASVGALTLNIAHGATITGVTKTINFGTGGLAGSITNINIGSQLSNATNTGAVKIQNSLWVNSVSNAIHYLTVTNAITGNPVLISAGGATDVSIRLTPAGSGSFLTGNLSFNTNTIASSSQLLFTSSSATQFTVNNNNFSVGTGNNGAISFSSVLASASSSLNSFTISASNGTGTGAHKAVRITGTLNNSSTGTYDGLSFEPSITIFSGQLNLITSTLNSASNYRGLNFSGTVEHNLGGNLNLTGSAKIATYAGNTTVGNGVASILGTFSVTGRTTIYTAQSIMTIPATGVYEVVVAVNNSNPANFTNLTLNYTSGGIGQTHDKFNLFTVGFRATETYLISCDASTALTFTTVLAGATTHDILIYVKRIA